MKSPFSHSAKEQPSDEPPSYEQSEQTQNSHVTEAPQYSGNSPQAPDEYPPDKKGNPEGNRLDGSEKGGQNADFYGDSGSGNTGNNSANTGNTQPPPGTYTLSGTYTLPPQKINIAYESDGHNLRPGYDEYLKRDKERVAQGDVPKPREAFRHGAPLAPSKKGSGSSGGFPGSHGPTYYDSASK